MTFLYRLVTTKTVVMAPFLAFSQTSIQGTVFDARTKEPPAGVNISSEDRKTGILTNANGQFSFNSATEKMLISAIGYQQQLARVDGVEKCGWRKPVYFANRDAEGGRRHGFARYLSLNQRM